MKSKIIPIISLILATLFLSPLMVRTIVSAAEGGSEGGQSTICGYNLCSSYGATWRWYPTDSDTVRIAGTVNGLGVRSPAYAKDTVIKGCRKEGGYWRYAMVAEVTKPGAVRTDGTPVLQGEQVGTTSIGNTNDLTLRSEMFRDGGGMVYREENDHGKSWYDIQKIYEAAQQADPSTFWRGWNSASSLAWFCAPNPDLTYYAESNASANGSYRGTGIVEKGEASVPTISIKKGEKVDLTFSHNIYSSSEVKNVDWQMQRTVQASITGGVQISLVGFQWSSYFNFDDNPEWGTWKGKADLTKEGNYGNAKYTAATRDYTDGSRSFLTRDNLGEVTFKMSGTYTLCETMYIGATPIQYTKACITVTVEDCDPSDPACVAPDTPTQPEELDLCKQWEPSEYSASYANDSGLGEGWARTRSGVRNPDISPNWAVSNGSENGAKFDDNPVYARPGQEIEWNHCYYPGIQKMANKATVTTHWSLCWADQDFQPVNNNISPWENKFSIKASHYYPNNSTNAGVLKTTMLQQSDDGKGNFDIGDSTTQTWGIDTYTVETGKDSKAGKILTETMTSGSPQYAKVSTESHSRGCCDHSCTCGEGENEHSCCCDGGDSITIHVKDRTTQPYSDTAMVKVPYNYENTISVKIDESKNNGVAYAGEIINVYSPTVQVSPRENEVTNGVYATKVDGGEIKILTYVTNVDQSGDSASTPTGEYGSHGSNLCNAISGKEECAEVDNREKVFNDPENLGGSTEQVELTNGGAYNVFDNSAGKWYCVVAAVYPANSGGPTNMNGTKGNAGSNSWRFSVPDCVQIAKRPSLQIWGNSLYTSGRVKTSVAGKRVIAGIYSFTPQSKDYQTIFGSWAEHSIVANKEIDGMASGASTGDYNGRDNNVEDDRTPYEGLGGSKEGNDVSICIRSPLTFSNFPCSSSNNPGGLVANSTDSTTPSDKSALLSRFTSPSQNYDLIEHTGDYTINDAAEVVPTTGQTRIIQATGTININTNLQYEQTAAYMSTVEIPKLIIYANKIVIGCTVTHIDAVLISDTEVNTCTSDQNSRENSIQLKIFGTVITDSLKANRTYGAATGTNSTVPAEIIDYDTSLYLWGAPRADASASGKLDITYQTELAPRY